MDNYTEREGCAICGNKDMEEIIVYGNIPLAGYFPTEDEIDKVDKYPFSLVFCNECTLVQSSGTIDPEVLFRDYRYMSSVGLSDHFKQTAVSLKNKFKLNKKHRILEIGSNDGVLLQPLMEEGLVCLGIEPARNIARIAKQKGCHVINEFFTEKLAKNEFIKETTDLVIANNCFAHIPDINDMMRGIKFILKKNGYLVVEVHYGKRLLEGLQYDNIYHEHIYYYSLTALQNLFSRYDMSIAGYEEIPVHCGSLRVYVKNNEKMVSEEVMFAIADEKDNVANFDWYKTFAEDVSEHKGKLKSMLEIISKKNKIVGYGASGRCNLLCNICGIDTDIIEYIVDESPERNERYIPGQNIPIVSRDYFEKDDSVRIVLIFAWNYSRMIIEKLKGRDLMFIIPFPSPRMVKTVEELGEVDSL